MDPITKYLDRYAQPQTGHLVTSGTFTTALVVPAYDEERQMLEHLLERAELANAILILVVNTPDSAPPEARDRTHILLDAFVTRNNAHLLCIDCVSTPLPRRQGVGLARKIGCDHALRLFVSGQVQSPWIYTTDADAHLPSNYFSHPLETSTLSGGACVFAHRHLADSETLQIAADLYDIHMAYYLAGLGYAGSRYAFPTLGSTIAVHARTYAQVRGFPRRNAAEDFYLLNKIAKIAPVTFHPDVTLDLKARLSERVPFGTGPALKKILQNDGVYESYNFEAFRSLRTTLAALENFARDGRLVLGEPERSILTLLGWDEREARFRDAYQPEPRKRVVLDWFDGLKTLRYMHAAAEIHPDQPLLETVAQLPDDVTAILSRHYRRDLPHS